MNDTLLRSGALALLFGLSLPPAARAQATGAPPMTAPAPLPVAPVLYDADRLPPAFHRGRREAVREALPSRAVAVFFGAPERVRSNDTDYEYRQDSNLTYLTGTPEAGSALVILSDPVEVDGVAVDEILFVPPRDPGAETWTGRRLGTARAEELLGVARAVDNTRFREVMLPLLRDPSRPLFRLPLPRGVPEGSDLAEQLEVWREGVAREGFVDGPPAPPVDSTTLRRLLAGLRQQKTPEELRLLRRAIDITALAHRELLEQAEAGWPEYRMEALVEYVFHREGAEHPGFNSIVGSGENSTVLHYESNRRVTQPGDVVVVDIGAEVHGYSADVTRTIPVSGAFTPEQRAIYDLVLAAQREAIEAARPGASFRAMGRAATRVLLDGMAELGLIAGPDDLAGLRRFFMHGTSHYIGLDVHDVGTYGPLEPGQVVTVEPGIYIAPASDIDERWWNIGVRIEDDVLITEDGPEVLSAGAPSDPEEIEKIMAGESGSDAARSRSP